MNLHRICHDLPIGTRVRLPSPAGSYSGIQEIQGYEWYENSGKILFRDGSSFCMDRADELQIMRFK